MEKDIHRFAREHGLPENRVTDVSAGICPIGPSRKVKAAIRKDVKNVRQCPDPDLPYLRKLFFSKYGIAGEKILFANSLKELLYLIPAVFRPKRVLIAGPAPLVYSDAARSSDAEVIYIQDADGSGFLPGAGSLRQYLDGVDLLFIANPNRITGRLGERTGLFSLLKEAASKGVRIVLDEALIEFTGDDSYLPQLADEENIIALRTSAFFYGLPGLELAYAVSSGSTINKLASRSLPEVNVLASGAARAAFRDRAYRKAAEEYVRAEKKLLMRELRKIPGMVPYESDTNVLLVRLDNPQKGILSPLARAGFFIRTCGDVEGLDETFLRLSVMGHDHNLKLIRIIRDLLQPRSAQNPGVKFMPSMG